MKRFLVFFAIILIVIGYINPNSRANAAEEYTINGDVEARAVQQYYTYTVIFQTDKIDLQRAKQISVEISMEAPYDIYGVTDEAAFVTNFYDVMEREKFNYTKAYYTGFENTNLATKPACDMWVRDAFKGAKIVTFESPNMLTSLKKSRSANQVVGILFIVKLDITTRDDINDNLPRPPKIKSQRLRVVY